MTGSSPASRCSRAYPPSSARRRLRPRYSRDSTVPTGVPMMSAISRTAKPST